MKSLTIALKDMGRSFRSYFALAFMFGVPILMTLMFAFLFGGIGGEEQAFTVPVTDVILVNQDEGSPHLPNLELDGQSYSSLGAMLVDLLGAEDFSELMRIRLAEEADARSAVNAQEAGVAVIIPPDFTNALIGQSEGQVAIEFYKDPELSLGPQLTQSIVMGIVDYFSSGTISLETVMTVLGEHGITLSQTELLELIQTLTRFSEFDQPDSSSLTIILPTGPEAEAEPASLVQNILRGVMGGMMIFYAFFTGTSTSQSILEEEENGTLARLFISPTDTRTILNGKFMAGFLIIIIQVNVLLFFANLVFRINWGPLLPLILFSIGLVALSGTFGIFIMSLVKGTKQAGVIYGGVLTFTGMLGISSVFTGGTPVESLFEVVPLIVPQGWAMNALKASWSGNLANTLLYTGGMLIWAVFFLAIGTARFKKRFA